MKKSLLLTTALVGMMSLATTAKADDHESQSPIDVTISGSGTFVMGVVDDGDFTKVTGADRRGDTSDFDAEVILNAEGQTDSGFVYGAQIQLLPDENDPEEGDDQQFVYFSDYWGRVEAGEADGAAEKMAIYAPNDFGAGGITGKYYQLAELDDYVGGESGYTQLSAPNRRYKASDSETASKLSYFTPRFAGLQLGLSYASDGDGDSSRNDKADTTGPGKNTTSGLIDANGQSEVTDFQKFLEVGANYEAEMDDISFALGVSYVTADAKHSAYAEDLEAYQVGADVSFMGFTVGGGYVNQGESGYDKTSTNKDDSEAYNFGIQYETGPFIVGANMLYAEDEGNLDETKNNEFSVYSLGATYMVAPGLATFVEGTLVSAEGNYGGANGNYDEDGSVFIIGTKVEF